MSSFKALCVFCGSRMGTDPAHEHTARTLGALLAERGIRLVYGGGGIGLMGALADSVMKAGGEVTGVIPEFLQNLEVGMTGLTETIVVDSMHDRKRRMFELSDSFVILPGGLGTLDETMEIITWKQLRLHGKPIVVLDVGGFWAPLAALVDRVIDGGFAHERVRDLFTVVTRVEDVLPALAAAPEPAAEVLTSHL